MKHSGKCPKCQSTDIIRVDESTYPGTKTANYIPVSFVRAVDVPRYICLRCGYSEEWIDPENIPHLRQLSEYKKKNLY